MAYRSVELSVVVSGVLLFVLLSLEPLKLSRSLSIFLSYLIAIIVLGVVSSFFYEYVFFDRLRDFIHFIKPVLLCFTAYLLVIRIDNVRYVLRLIVFIGVFLAVKHFFDLAFADLPDEFRIDRVRAKAGAGSFIELLALIILLAFRKSTKIVGPETRRLFIVLMSISFVLYFSRTMILGLLIFLLSIYGFTKLTRKAFEYSAVIFAIFGLFYASLFAINLQEGKEGLNRFLLKLRDAPTEVFSAPKGYDPTNRSEIYKHWRGYEATLAFDQMQGNPFHYISGKGFGALVDLGFNAPLGEGDGMRSVPHLHNGYMYVFFKVGIIGLILYLVLLFNVYKQVYIKSHGVRENMLRRITSGFGVYFFASSLVITGLYNLGEISIFCLGIFFALVEIESRKNKEAVHE
jgi:hypothetical protein